MNKVNCNFNKYFNTLRYLFFLAWARNKARFAKTKLGSFWVGVTTLLTVSSLAFVYGTVFKVDNLRAYIAYIGLGILYWNNLSTLIYDFSTLLTRSRDRLLSSSMNILDVIIEEYIFSTQNLMLSMVTVLPVLAFIYPRVLTIFSLKFILGFLIYLIIIFINALLTSLFTLLSADLRQLIPVILQLSFLLSPILYLKEAIIGKEWVFMYNPLYLPIGIVRDTILDYNKFSHLFLIKVLFSCSVILFFCFFIIRKYSRKINLYIDY